jgi:polar amino acid transport system substrate-binding protein
MEIREYLQVVQRRQVLTLPYNRKLEPDTYVALGEPFSQSLAGIPVLKTEPQLRDAVKVALEQLQTNGAYDALLDKYGLKANKLAPITVNKGN